MARFHDNRSVDWEGTSPTSWFYIMSFRLDAITLLFYFFLVGGSKHQPSVGADESGDASVCMQIVLRVPQARAEPRSSPVFLEPHHHLPVHYS